MKKYIAIMCVLLLFVITACAPATPEVVCNAPYILVDSACCLDENANGICDDQEAVEELPEMGEAPPAPEVIAEEPEEVSEEPEAPTEPEKTEIETFVETSEYLYGTPGDVRAGSYQAPEFLKTIAFKNKLGNRLVWWGLGFEISQIEKYAITIITFPDGETKTWDLDVYDDVIFDNSPQCEGDANCGSIPFAYTWDQGTSTKLYCPLSIPICEDAKVKYVDPY